MESLVAEGVHLLLGGEPGGDGVSGAAEDGEGLHADGAAGTHPHC